METLQIPAMDEWIENSGIGIGGIIKMHSEYWSLFKKIYFQ